ncbi:hypothetical protein EUX98_g4491 [Antrodiella citrinella]|uniref:Flavin reductase like domain-containing protein n=1 Tax=Antrodiella citrinella TaxID=2447956 RepID=A0A4S4MTX9_9APHY|nr:hypothetical protein EUX98_g4491 [Antrodiella citrinella]
MAQPLSVYTPPEFKYTASPNPGFKYGQKVAETESGKAWLEGEKDGWKDIDPAEIEPVATYLMMISAITPRPVAFVSSLSEAGDENLALFSWFNMVTHNPPLISISVSTSKSALKDTAHNIKATKEFTVSIISEPWVDNANVCAVDAPSDVNEWLISGLTKEPSLRVKPARVKESAFTMECELYKDIDIPNAINGGISTTLFLGLIKHIHVRKDMLNARGTVDPAKLQPVGRMGDILYGSLGGGYRLARPAWSAEGEVIQEFIKTKENDNASAA